MNFRVKKNKLATIIFFAATTSITACQKEALNSSDNTSRSRASYSSGARNHSQQISENPYEKIFKLISFFRKLNFLTISLNTIQYSRSVDTPIELKKVQIINREKIDKDLKEFINYFFSDLLSSLKKLSKILGKHKSHNILKNLYNSFHLEIKKSSFHYSLVSTSIQANELRITKILLSNAKRILDDSEYKKITDEITQNQDLRVRALLNN